MFEIIINSTELYKALDYIEPAIENGMIYLESTDIGECILYSENKECAISISLITASVPQKATTDYIDYKVFKKLISTLKGEGNIIIHQDDNANEVLIHYRRGVKPVQLKTMSLPLLTKNPLAVTSASSDSARFSTTLLCAALKVCTEVIDGQGASSVLDCCDFKVSKDHGMMYAINTNKATGCTKKVPTSMDCNQEEFIMNLKPLKKVSSLFSSFKEMIIFQDANGICICSGEEKVTNNKTGEDKLENVTEVRIVLHKFSSNYPTNVFYGVKHSDKTCMLSLDAFNNSLDKVMALTDSQDKDVILEADDMNLTMSVTSKHGIIEDKIPLKVGSNVPFKGKFNVDTLKTIANLCKPFKSLPFTPELYISPSSKSDSIFVMGSEVTGDNSGFITSKVINANTQDNDVEDIEDEEEESA